MIDNAMTQQFIMYSTLEAVLRKAVLNNKPLSLLEIRNAKEVKHIEKNAWEVRDRLKALTKKGFVNCIDTPGQTLKWTWNTNAVPLTQAQMNRNMPSKRYVQPSEVKVVKPEVDVPIKIQTDAKFKADVDELLPELELVIQGLTLTISKNPLTGRPRIVIEG